LLLFTKFINLRPSSSAVIVISFLFCAEDVFHCCCCSCSASGRNHQKLRTLQSPHEAFVHLLVFGEITWSCSAIHTRKEIPLKTLCNILLRPKRLTGRDITQPTSSLQGRNDAPKEKTTNFVFILQLKSRRWKRRNCRCAIAGTNYGSD
jgi:hypothetical protein